MNEKAADKGQVEGTRRTQICCLDCAEFGLDQRNGRATALIEDLTRRGQRLRTSVQADDSSAGADLFGQHEQGTHRAAADIDGPITRSQVGAPARLDGK